MNRREPRYPTVLPMYIGAMILFFILRVLFHLYNSGCFRSRDLGDTAFAYLGGLMIDSSVAATALLAVFLVAIVIWLFSRRAAHIVTSVLGSALIAVFLLVNLIDIAYFAEFNSRMNILFLDSLGQMGPIMHTIFDDYPVFTLLVVWIAAVVFFLWLVRRIGKPIRRTVVDRYPRWSAGAVVLVLAFLTFLWTPQPFWRSSQFSFRDQALNQLSLNGVYTLIKAYDQKRINERDEDGVDYSFMPNEEAVAKLRKLVIDQDEVAVDSVFPFARIIRQPETLAVRKPNIVIILMESFTASYVGALRSDSAGYSPEFDRLASQGIFFTRFYGQGIRTHFGLVSTVASFPSVLGMFLTRRRGTESFYTLGNLLGEYGYQTSFIYGFDQNFDHMGFFMKQGGFEHVIDREGFDEPTVLKGRWGYSDEDLYARADRYFRSLDPHKPFFSVLMTSSNHAPFDVPGYFKESHPKLADDKDKLAFTYSDYCLGQYLEQARERDYFKRTIFVVVSDHGEIRDKEDREFKRLHIPCLIYSPSLLPEPKVVSTVASQVDIGTTLLHLIGYPGVFHTLGRDVLSLPPQEGWAIARSGNTVYLRYNDGVFVRDIRDTASTLYEVDGQERLLRNREIKDDSLKADLNRLVEVYLQTAHYLYSTGKHRYGLQRNHWAESPEDQRQTR